MSELVKSVFQSAVDRITWDEEQKVSGDIFELEPVPLDVFITDKAYLGLPKLSPRQFDAVDIATQIYFAPTLRELKWRRKRYVNELVLCWGKGSGKDYVSRIIHLRIVYLLSALKNPQAYYYHPDHPVGIEPFHLLNTATTKNQAASIFFSPLRKLIQHSPFFKVRSQVLTTEVRFEKGIYLMSGHSEAEAHEGMNLICAVLDEIAAFKTDEEVEDIRRLRLRKNIPQSASSVYDFVHSSRVTRFPQIGKIVLLSFPRFKGDFIMTKYDEGKDRKSVYVDKGTTFDINPTKKESDFAEEAEVNPTRYNCRILCQPSIAEDAFFKNEKAIKRGFSREIDHPVDKDTNRLKQWFYCEDKFSRFMHVDLAKNRDRAAIAMCHAYEAHEHTMRVRDSEGKEEEKIVQLPMIRLDLLMYFVALPGREIDYDMIQDTILDLNENRGFKISLCTFDGYQSVQMMQTLEHRGIPTDNLSVDRTREPYESFQDVLYDGRFISFYDEILVEEEIPFLIDYKGRKIEHRKGRGKDGSDAVAGAIHNCVVDEGWGGFEIGVGDKHDDELQSFLKSANRRLGDASIY